MRSSLRGPDVLSSPRVILRDRQSEWFTEIVVDNLLPGLRFSTSDGFGGVLIVTRADVATSQ